nr:hypothetical protein [Brevundimonas sp. SH203]
MRITLRARRGLASASASTSPPAIAQGLSETLAPVRQVGLAWIEPGAVGAQDPHRQMDMRMSVILMKGEDIGKALAEHVAGEDPGGVVHAPRIGARRHAEDDRARHRAVAPPPRLQCQFGGPGAGHVPDRVSPLGAFAVRPLQR